MWYLVPTVPYFRIVATMGIWIVARTSGQTHKNANFDQRSLPTHFDTYFSMVKTAKVISNQKMPKIAHNTLG